MGCSSYIIYTTRSRGSVTTFVLSLLLSDQSNFPFYCSVAVYLLYSLLKLYMCVSVCVHFHTIKKEKSYCYATIAIFSIWRHFKENVLMNIIFWLMTWLIKLMAEGSNERAQCMGLVPPWCSIHQLLRSMCAYMNTHCWVRYCSGKSWNVLEILIVLKCGSWA